MLAEILNIAGEPVGEITLSDTVFNTEINKNVIYEAIKHHNALLRAGTSFTKNKSLVSGSGRKPWRQKGTGRARHGSRRSVQWVGGGRAFGGQHKNYKYKLNKKVKRSAIKSLLSFKAKNNLIKIVEKIDVKAGKTKELVAQLNKIVGNNKKVLILIVKPDILFKRAARNIPWLRYTEPERVSADLIYNTDYLLLTVDAVEKLNQIYS